MKRKIQLSEPLLGAVVVDLDGTLYDDNIGRETLTKSGWTEYFKLCDSFPFDKDVFRELTFFSMEGMQIFFISEQPECLRRVVERGLVNFSDFEPWQLILKPEDCTLSGPRFKMSELQKIYENHEICIIIQSMSLTKLCKETGFKRLYPVNPKNNFNYPEPVALCAVPPEQAVDFLLFVNEEEEVNNVFAKIAVPTLKDMAEQGIGKLLIIFPVCAETKQNGSEPSIPSRLIRMRSILQTESHASSIKRIVRKIIKLILAITLMLYC